MKNHLRTYWWVVFLAVNFIPGKSYAEDQLKGGPLLKKMSQDSFIESRQAELEKIQKEISDRAKALSGGGAPSDSSVPPISGPGQIPAPAPAPNDPNMHYITNSELATLIPGFGVSSALDEDKNLVFTGKVPAYCMDKFSIDESLRQSEGVLILAIKDPNGAFKACVTACNSGQPSMGQCKKIDIKDKTVSGDSDVGLTIAIAKDGKGGYDATDWTLQSSEDSLEQALAWQAENCRGKTENSFEQNMSDLLTADTAIKKLDARGFFKGNEAFRDGQLSEIKTARTKYQADKVASFVAAVTDIESTGFDGDSVGALNSLRKAVKAFERNNKGAVTNDISDLYQKIASADLAMNAHQYANPKDYFAAMKRAQGDFAAARGLKGLNSDSKLALVQFRDGLSAHELTYLSSRGAEGMAMYGMVSRNLQRQLQMDLYQSGCANTSARFTTSSSGVLAPTALNSNCAYLTSASQYVTNLNQYQNKSLQAQQDQVRFAQESDAFDQFNKQQAANAKMLADLNQDSINRAQQATSQRTIALAQQQRLQNGQLAPGVGGIAPNGQMLPNGGLLSGPQAPRPAMTAPTPPASFNFFGTSSSLPTNSLVGSTMIGSG